MFSGSNDTPAVANVQWANSGAASEQTGQSAVGPNVSGLTSSRLK